MMTAGTEHILAADLAHWLALAEPRQRIVYATGFLVHSLHEAKDDGTKLEALQQETWRAHEKGKVCLVQQRLGPKTFEYLAIRRNRK